MAIVAHELRNQLSAIVWGVDILNRTLPHDERSRRALDIVARNVAVQNRLLNDLLDFSRLRRDKLTLQLSPVAIDEVARTAVNSHEAEAARAQVELTIDADGGLWVVGDPDRLQQAMVNLISNAIKFTPAGGRISVTLSGCAEPVDALRAGVTTTRPPKNVSPASVCFVVEDTGTGVDPALLARIFERFQQGEVAGQHQKGLGLGLALVKAITEKHGGTVWAEAKSPDCGSRFVIALPALATEHRVQSVPHPGEPCVMVVEDNADTRCLMTASLQSAGYRVITAASGEEGLRLIMTTSDRPDLILSDISLPGIDGYEFVRRARRIHGMSLVPAFAVTGSDCNDDLKRARQAGFEGHFAKPVDMKALHRAISYWFSPEAA